MRYLALIGITSAFWLARPVLADITIPMHHVSAEGTGENAGSVTVSTSDHGLVFTPQLEGLEPGIHGFHIHQNPSCEPAEQNGNTVAAGAAGGHFDPAETDRHAGPWGDGHLGDLPALYVDPEGKAQHPVLAPRLKVLSDIAGRSLMVHEGGDNHADHPEPLGGGGARVICGVVPGS